MDKAKQSMKEKVPEIKRSLELVKHLQERQVGAAIESGSIRLSRGCCGMCVECLVAIYSFTLPLRMIRSNVFTCVRRHDQSQVGPVS